LPGRVLHQNFPSPRLFTCHS